MWDVNCDGRARSSGSRRVKRGGLGSASESLFHRRPSTLTDHWAVRSATRASRRVATVPNRSAIAWATIPSSSKPRPRPRSPPSPTPPPLRRPTGFPTPIRHPSLTPPPPSSSPTTAARRWTPHSAVAITPSSWPRTPIPPPVSQRNEVVPPPFPLRRRCCHVMISY